MGIKRTGSCGDFRSEGCVHGPNQRCPEDAPVLCDACISSGFQ